MQSKIEIYKLAVEMADRVSARRLTANGFFLSINTVLTTLLGFIYKDAVTDRRSFMILITSTGVIMSLTWFFAIRSYKQLNKAKFSVINEIEKDLPYAYFTREWEMLKSQTESDNEVKPLREKWVRFRDRYTELTNVERAVPFIFIVLYLSIALSAFLGIMV